MTARGTGQPGTRGPDADDAPRSISYPKAALLLAGAVALGAYLLQLGPAPAGGSRTTSSTTTTTSTTAPPSSTGSTTTTSTTTTTTPTSPAKGAPTGSVKVLVANASQTNGVATFYTHRLASHGWGTLTPVTALTVAATSSVYYAPGDQAYAATIVTELGVAASPQPVSVATPVANATTAQVVVVIGDDLAAKAHPAG